MSDETLIEDPEADFSEAEEIPAQMALDL